MFFSTRAIQLGPFWVQITQLLPDEFKIHKLEAQAVELIKHVLRNYIFIDEERLDSFAQQIRTQKRERVKRGKKVHLSITGLGVELSEEDTWRELSPHEKIEKLVDFLETEDVLDTSRP